MQVKVNDPNHLKDDRTIARINRSLAALRPENPNGCYAQISASTSTECQLIVHSLAALVEFWPCRQPSKIRPVGIRNLHGSASKICSWAHAVSTVFWPKLPCMPCVSDNGERQILEMCRRETLRDFASAVFNAILAMLLLLRVLLWPRYYHSTQYTDLKALFETRELRWMVFTLAPCRVAGLSGFYRIPVIEVELSPSNEAGGHEQL
jgi:hypothetical protein